MTDSTNTEPDNQAKPDITPDDATAAVAEAATPVAPASTVAAPAPTAGGGLALAALIVGIVAMVAAITPILSFVAFIPAVAAALLGIIVLAKRKPGHGKGLAGVILGGVALLLAIIVSISTIMIGVAGSNNSTTAGTVAESPADAPSSEPTKAPTPKPTEKPAEVIPTDVVYTGTGDSVLSIALPDGADSAGVATLTHVGSSNFAVWSLDANMTQQSLLVNTIGSYSGTVLFDVNMGEQTSSLEITADGPWTVTLHSIKSLREFAGNAASGTGDDVVVYRGKAGAATITHVGESNFAVWTYGDSTDLVVNEIGTYTGTVRWGAGPAIVAVSADGPWTITVG